MMNSFFTDEETWSDKDMIPPTNAKNIMDKTCEQWVSVKGKRNNKKTHNQKYWKFLAHLRKESLENFITHMTYAEASKKIKNIG